MHRATPQVRGGSATPASRDGDTAAYRWRPIHAASTMKTRTRWSAHASSGCPSSRMCLQTSACPPVVLSDAGRRPACTRRSWIGRRRLRRWRSRHPIRCAGRWHTNWSRERQIDLHPRRPPLAGLRMPRFSRRPQILLVATAYVDQLRFAHREPSSRYTKSGLTELFWACGDDAVARSTTIRLTPSASADAALATAQSVLERRGFLWEPTAEAFA